MKIVIAGGGSAGWMSAAALAHTFPDWDITVIAGDEPIGVGESTTPHINQYLKYMGIDDETFLREARATFKAGSKFEDFAAVGHTFYYGNAQELPKGTSYYQWMLADAFGMNPPPFIDVFMPFMTVAAEGKMPLNNPKLKPYDLKKDRSFHIDATKFSEFLRKTYCKNVRVIDSKVKSVRYEGKRIQYVTVARGETDLRDPQVDADLYIDCTGQASTLGGSQSSWQPIDTLNVDTAIVRREEYTNKDEQMHCYTHAKGLSSGWQWRIPTWDFISTGYVFSSKHQTEEDAKKEFGDGRVVNFRTGRFEEAWVGNCVKIGLSYGFVEPLESTSLFNTHHGILQLVDTLATVPDFGQFERDNFNWNLAEHFDGWKEFVEAHYYYSSRKDTPFWRSQTDEMDYEKVGSHEFIRHYMTSDEAFNPEQFHPIVYIMAGAGKNHINRRHYGYFNYPIPVSQRIVDDWNEDYELRKSFAASLPTMYKYLSDTFHKDS